VRMDFPATSETGVMQDRTGSSSINTVHEPHNPIPQLNFVPVKPSMSRNTHNNGMDSFTSTV